MEAMMSLTGVVPAMGALVAGAVAALLLQDGPIGCFVALFYGNVAVIMAAGTGDPLTPQLLDWQQRGLEASLVLLGSLIVLQFLRVNARGEWASDSASKTEQAEAQPSITHRSAPRGVLSTLPVLSHVHGAEVWRALPDEMYAAVLSALPTSDAGTMRLVCHHWLDTSRRAITTLKPKLFPVRELVAALPRLRSLDLSDCTQDISASKLRHLRKLRGLGELNLGCHHRLIACTVTDKCLAELVALTGLTSLNLSQCVHVGDAGMMSLVYLPSLRALNISGCVAVTDIGVMMVAQLTGLTSLEMPWCLKVTNIGLEALAPLRRLRTLNISGCQLVTEAGIAALAAFSRLERLSMLNLDYSKAGVTDAALASLSGLSNLRALSIGGMQLADRRVTDKGLAQLASSFGRLTQLGLMGLDVGDEGIAHLAQLSNLQALSVRSCARVTGGCIASLSRLTLLSDLCLLHNPKMEVSDAVLAGVASLRGLQVLGLGNYQPGPAPGSRSLASLASLPGLRVLSLAFYSGEFGEEGARVLARLSALQHLDLQGAAHVDEATLAAVGTLTTLQSLHLSRCARVGDAAVAHLSGLAALGTLNLSHCHLVGDAALATVGRMGALTHLLLQQCNEVTDAGVAALAPLAALQLLDLSCCERVTGAGFERWGGPACQLATLVLANCTGVNDAGLRSVGRLVSLTRLDLTNCALVGDAGVAALRNLHLLTGLDLAQCVRVTNAGVRIIAASMPALATLKLNGCVSVTDAGVAHLARLTSLLTVHLDRCARLSDDGVAALARLTGLTSLRISRCPGVSDRGVAALAGLSRLSTLSLAHCTQVTDMGLMALSPLTTLANLEF